MSSFASYLTEPEARFEMWCDRVEQFEGADVPPEVLALGQAEQVHGPSALGRTLVGSRYLIALAIAMFAGLLGVVTYPEWHKLDALTLGVLAIVALSFLGVAAWVTTFRPTKITVFLYERAAVVVEGNTYTLIPWKHFLLFPSKIRTTDGQEFFCGWLADHDGFEDRVRERAFEQWLPAATARIGKGETVTVGELAITAKEVSFKGKTAPWAEVNEMVHVVGRLHELRISTVKPRWDDYWAKVNLHQVPNPHAVVALIANICPERLLVADPQAL